MSSPAEKQQQIEIRVPLGDTDVLGAVADLHPILKTALRTRSDAKRPPVVAGYNRLIFSRSWSEYPQDM
ncbi:hypothetical protein ACSNOK_06650 [Streptomyces sp. URMC 126]|uniref:hypothetical protein n=1 Tax=Streptomyces sp. URMC 126 TaxID=3423401 RepID=UPI003F1A0855